ncbi:methionine adenosyltransferase [Streptomyces sp. NPDC005407]|uniref:methionine adenosyltransferase n=1 Tax=Streptomyces sp. NPDC005407 TaxID=3155340 RepID=UPI0033BBA92D
MSLRLFTSESVTEGNPDKIADQVSDTLLDALLKKDPTAQVVIETLITTGLVHVTGKVTATRFLDVPTLVRGKILEIGYDDSAKGFDGASCEVSVSVELTLPGSERHTSAAGRQRDRGDDREVARHRTGDVGLVLGYACDETPQLMPLPIVLAHQLSCRLAEVRRNGALPYLRPDGKTQVTIEYEGDQPSRLDSVVVCSQHAADIDPDSFLFPDVREFVVEPALRALRAAGVKLGTEDYKLLVNPAGKFIAGGPVRCAGLTGRKAMVDTYGGMARHGGEVFSGRDPYRSNRAAAYALRWVAKNVVAAELATRCEVQASYVTGEAAPAGLSIETFGTAPVAVEKIERAVREVFDLRPSAIVRDLDLLRPIYARTAAYGHFGRELPEFTWERTDRAAQLKSAALL